MFVKPVVAVGNRWLTGKYRAGGGWRLFLASLSAGPRSQKTELQHMFGEDKGCVLGREERKEVENTEYSMYKTLLLSNSESVLTV